MSSDPREFDDVYLPGAENKAIRWYFYLNSGLNVLNQSRNLFLGIFALYFAMKLENIWWLVAMFIPCVVLLTIVGYVNVHRISKVQEWLGIRFSSHYAIKTFDYNAEQTKLLAEIRDLLKK